MSEREPNIEKEVIDALLGAWKKYPDMRLTQLIVNAAAPIEADYIFSIEDSHLIKLLNQFKERY